MFTLHNQVQLIGRAGHDVELLRLSDDSYRATLRLYQHTRTPSNEGEPQAHALVGWGALAEQLARRVRRGDRIMVQGRLVNRKFEYAGVRQVRTEVHLTDFSVLAARSLTRAAALDAGPQATPAIAAEP